MRYGFISDIHGKVDGLVRVLKALKNRGLEKTNIYCLGDIISELPGGETNVCVSLLKDNVAASIKGNHDEYALHTRPSHISAASMEYLAGLPEKLEIGGLVLVHDSPDLSSRIGVHPLYRSHIRSDMHADAVFTADFKTAVIGHSHIAKAFWPGGSQSLANGGVFQCKSDERYILCVGSVSHPSDGNPNPSCAIYDTDKRTFEVLRPEN
jgi:predicted phosphodiesterase